MAVNYNLGRFGIDGFQIEFQFGTTLIQNYTGNGTPVTGIRDLYLQFFSL